MDSSETMDNLNMGLDPDSLDNLMVEEEGYWREVKAIIGGVLGFWGGVGGLGTMFLIVVLSQRYCCKEDDDDKGQLISEWLFDFLSFPKKKPKSEKKVIKSDNANWLLL